MIETFPGLHPNPLLVFIQKMVKKCKRKLLVQSVPTCAIAVILFIAEVTCPLVVPEFSGIVFVLRLVSVSHFNFELSYVFNHT